VTAVNDPLERLYIPVIAVRPRAEFLHELQRRVHAVLDVPLMESEPEMITDTRAPVDFALHYRDVNAALRWLNDVLGVTTEWVTPESGDGRHAGVRWRTGHISINFKRGIYELGPGAVILATESDDELDALYRRVSAAGAQIARPLGPNWDGAGRNFVVRDPEGNLWELTGP